MDFEIEMDEFKPGLDPIKPICRCCLSTDKRMFDAATFSLHFYELAAIRISPSDNLPSWICYECVALLKKSYNFKQKMLKAHVKLTEYLTRCLPFPIDPRDLELSFYATPQLIRTDTLCFNNNNNGKTKDGYHSLLQHKKPSMVNVLDDIRLPLVMAELGCDVIASEGIKAEAESFSDFEDDVPLDQFRSQIDKVESDIIEEEIKDVDELLNDSRKEKKRGRKKGVKNKKKEKVSESGNGIVKKERISSIRNKPQELDPEKIRIIVLNPEEQVRQREQASKEGVKFPFHCKLCYKGYNYESKLENHMLKHSKTRGKFVCKLCTMYFPSLYSHATHMYIHTRRFQCVKCGRSMIDREAMVQHYRIQHEGIVTIHTCHICGKMTNNKKTLRSHMFNYHSGDRPKCDQCGKTFINKDSLTAHLQIHEGLKLHECEKCGKKFRTRTQSIKHQYTHSNIKDFYCVECDVRFKSEHSLKQHLFRTLKHQDKRTLKYGCSQCSRRFDSGRALARHEAVQHRGERAHACPACPARLATRGSLNKHRAQVHALKRPPANHVCHTCGKAFRSKSVLVNHVRTHTGEKPFACVECGRGFAQRTAMKTHMKLVHMKNNSNTKVKPEFQTEAAEAKLFMKDEPTTVLFDTWERQPIQPCDIQFTVFAQP